MKPCPLCHLAPADLWEIPKGYDLKCDRDHISTQRCGQPATNVTPYWHDHEKHFHFLGCVECHVQALKNYYLIGLRA